MYSGETVIHIAYLSLQDHNKKQIGGQKRPCLAFDECVLLSAWWMHGWLIQIIQQSVLLLDRGVLFCYCSWLYVDIAYDILHLIVIMSHC